MSYKCVIFDCDGVLVDSEPIAVRVLIEMAENLGADFKMPRENIIREFSGVSLSYTFSYIENILGRALPDGFEPEFRNNSFEAFKKELQPVEGVKELLKGIKQEYCVASSGPIEKIRLNLSLTGLLDKFEDKIFSSYDINSWKPDPDIFLYAAKSMGYQPSECVVVEDSVAGVKAARLGGFFVYGYAPENSGRFLADEGAHVFHSMRQLAEELNSLSSL
jgi:HAD superfamily hydrolase (TIGR01509 family)